MTTPGLVTDFPRPAPTAPRDYHFPRFTRHRLPNGVQVVVAPVHKLPVVTVLAVIEAGAVSEPVGREGVAQLTARALAEGRAGDDSMDLADRFELLGAAFDANADWDVTVARVTTTTAQLPAALGLVGEVLTAPSFPEREIERLKAERLADLLQRRMEPRGLADDIFSRVLYAPESRYASADDGEAETVRAVTRDDVVAFWRERYRPGGTTVVIAGDVTTEDALRLVDDALGAWHGEALVPARATDRPARLTRAVHLVHKADAAQTEIRIGHVGLPRLNPDYFAVTVMNALLGGLFNSRINLNLREEHGYTYGARSYFDWRRGAGPFVVSTAVASEVTHLAAREALNELTRFGEAPPDARELALAVDYLDGVFPIRYETTAAIAGALAGMVSYGLPEDYYDSYRGHVRRVTPEAVQQAARRHLHLDRLQFVVVGNAAEIRRPVEEMDFGPLFRYDAEGRLEG
ncbi:MAG: M16 family metallopeptidase [Gemmatimonadaceae bacterium]